jgi:hypothetical protein
VPCRGACLTEGHREVQLHEQHEQECLVDADRISSGLADRALEPNAVLEYREGDRCDDKEGVPPVTQGRGGSRLRVEDASIDDIETDRSQHEHAEGFCKVGDCLRTLTDHDHREQGHRQPYGQG